MSQRPQLSRLHPAGPLTPSGARALIPPTGALRGFDLPLNLHKESFASFLSVGRPRAVRLREMDRGVRLRPAALSEGAHKTAGQGVLVTSPALAVSHSRAAPAGIADSRAPALRHEWMENPLPAWKSTALDYR
jgi:hypothetical protein